MLVDCERGGRGRIETGADEWFCYVIEGRGTLNKRALTAGNFAYAPPGSSLEFVSGAKGTRLLIFQRNYEPLDGVEAPTFTSATRRTRRKRPSSAIRTRA